MTNEDKNKSPLAPAEPGTSSTSEDEKDASWIIRKLAGSISGRVVASTLESLRASANIVCLSPWGDNNSITIPNIRFRDIVVSGAVAATGGTAAIAGPALEPVADIAGGMMGGESVILELIGQAGFDFATGLADDKVFEDPIAAIIKNAKILETTAVKEMLISLEHKQTMGDASLGFFRSSLHDDTSLFAESKSKWKDYLAVSKGWMNPYLYASGRRPVIPRSMSPDIIYAHGPFLRGDYKIGQTLLGQSASVIVFDGQAFPPMELDDATDKKDRKDEIEQQGEDDKSNDSEGQSKLLNVTLPRMPNIPKLSDVTLPTTADMKSALQRSSVQHPAKPEPNEPGPRRMVVCVVGLKPHRKIWSTSSRPEESLMYYQLLNGCPSIALPVRKGVPLIAWDALTLDQLWRIQLPEDRKGDEALREFEGVVGVVMEFLDLCVDWKRMKRQNFTTKTEETVEEVESESKKKKHRESKVGEKEARKELHQAVGLLVAGAIKSGESAEARKQVDKDRAGIAMWRIP